jgi:hypothetical protein
VIENQCILCGEIFYPEESHYDDICDECADLEDEDEE